MNGVDFPGSLMPQGNKLRSPRPSECVNDVLSHREDRGGGT